MKGFFKDKGLIFVSKWSCSNKNLRLTFINPYSTDNLYIVFVGKIRIDIIFCIGMACPQKSCGQFCASFLLIVSENKPSSSGRDR